jgi:hypothetical protein
MLGRRVLRARTLPGITQEIYALLTVYQAIRIVYRSRIGFWGVSCVFLDFRRLARTR